MLIDSKGTLIETHQSFMSIQKIENIAKRCP
jgi:hypothetical protein